MFELELKFKPTKRQREKMITDLLFISEENFIDVYYDKKDYSLSANDIWLRSRNDIFMLKKPLQVDSMELKKQNNSPKKEVIDIEEIRLHLEMQNKNHENFHEELIANDIFDLYKYKNTRHKYKKDDFIIDFDLATFEDRFECEVCEIELIVNSKNEVQQGIERIKSFAIDYGMEVEPVKARLIEYIERTNPEHYIILEKNK